MPTGRLAALDVPAAAYTTLYAPAAYTNVTGDVGFPRNTASGIVSLVNRTSSPIAVRIAVVSSNAANPTPANADFVEYDFLLSGNQAIERTGVVWAGANNTAASPFTTGQQVVVYAGGAGVSAVTYGYEELI